MTNLATLIGVSNLEKLIEDNRNTYVVIRNDDGLLELSKNTAAVNYSLVVGIGNFQSCASLKYYLELQMLAS